MIEPDCVECKSLIARHDERLKTLERQMEDNSDIISTVQELAFSVRDIANEVKTVTSRVLAMEGDVKDIKSVPRKRWELLISEVIKYLVTAGIASLVTYLASVKP